MTATSAGSRPDPQRFLTDYAKGVEEVIQELQDERVPPEGDYALKGREPQDIASMVRSGAIQV
jgi:hypothetical protein